MHMKQQKRSRCSHSGDSICSLSTVVDSNHVSIGLGLLVYGEINERSMARYVIGVPKNMSGPGIID